MPLPPGCFSSNDIYYCKRWRRVRHITNEFWSGWHKEFLRTLQEQKTCKKRDQIFWNGNFVLLKAETYQTRWPVALVIETFLGKHGLV